MTPVLFDLDGGHPLFSPLCNRLNAEAGSLQRRRFPDGESYLRIDSEVRGRPALVLANLTNPDASFLPLAFLCSTLTELGASSVGLVAPYLCYMRQDCRFHSGEAVSSRIFAHLLSAQVNWLVTVDPHLHRYHKLAEIYSIPTAVVPAAPLLARWLKQQTGHFLLIGPDEESEQWVAQIAQLTGQPFAVGHKQRHSDRNVHVTLPDLATQRQRTAVVVDDVISSGHTLLETLSALKTQGFQRVECLAVHGLFADNADQALQQAGLENLATSNSIPHPSNQIDLTDALIEPLRQFLHGPVEST